MYGLSLVACAVVLALLVPVTRSLRSRLGSGDLALGFFATTAMWAIAYLAMMRSGLVAGELLFSVTLLVPAMAGYWARRTGSATPWRVGAVSATVNLLIVGSLFSKDAGDVWRVGALWVGGLYALSIGLAAVGGRFARPGTGSGTRDGFHTFAAVCAGAVFLLLVTGGLVTGLEQGLAVPDWPNTFGHNMLLYPLSEMKEGVYYEHAHRLFGTLVGLTTLMMTAVAWAERRPAAIRWGSVLVLAAVVLQGLMGGMRVTGAITMSQDANELAPSLAFAVAHGIFGQVVFAGLCALAAAAHPNWRRAIGVAGGAVRNPATALLVILALQLFFGACYRHLQLPDPTTGAPVPAKWAMHAHLGWSVVAMASCIWVGIKAMHQGARGSALRRDGMALHGLVLLQVGLGVAALLFVIMRQGTAIPTSEVIFTTAHQATGALLLGTAAATWVWFRAAVPQTTVNAPQAA